MSAPNLPITALKFAGQGLGLAGRSAIGAAQFGGRTLVSPGIIGSMARWTAASMVLSSLPNPAARKQAIDKALNEANREAERHYMSLKEDLKRQSKLAKREREFTYTQRIIDARFMANPEERNFERRLAEIDKKFGEALQKIEETSLKRQQLLEESNRIMDSRRDTTWWENTKEDWGNWGKRWYNTGINTQQGFWKTMDLGTGGFFNLAGTEAEWDKHRAGQTLTSKIPEEFMRKFGDQLNHRIELANGSVGEFRDGQRIINAKTEEDHIAILQELNKHVEKIGENQRHAEQMQAKERQETAARHARMLNAIEQSNKAKQSGFLDIQTDSVIQDAQLDAVLHSRFASPEQKMVAKMDKEALAEQTAISLKYNEKRNELVATGNLLPVKQEDQDTLNAKYREKHQENYRQAKAAYDERFGEDKEKQLQELADSVRQQKQNDTSDGLFGNLEKSALVGKYAKQINEMSLPSTRHISDEAVKNDPEYKKRAAEIEQGYEDNFKKSREYQAYETREGRIAAEHAKENTALKNQKEYRKRGDIEGRAIDHQEAVEKAQSAMKFEERKRAIQAAMQLPVRSGLEESYNMVNDELIRQGEAQRLGGNSEVAKVVDESIKPALEKLDRHYEKLERVLKTGEVQATVRVKM